MRSLRSLVSLASIVALVPPSLAQGTLTTFSRGIPALGYGGGVTDLNADGSTAVGTGFDTSGDHAFRWRDVGGLVYLPEISFGGAIAHAVSSDGAVVGGEARDTNGASRACLWPDAQTIQVVGPPGVVTRMKALGADGSIGAGEVLVGTDWHAYRWTSSGGIVDLGTLSGATRTFVQGMSHDGDVIVGTAMNSASPSTARAFRWTQSTGVVPLPPASAGQPSEANDVSADGSTVVGIAGVEAGYWDSSGSFHSIADPAWVVSEAMSTNIDGSVIVGMASIAGPRRVTFRWVRGGGISLLANDLVAAGGPSAQRGELGLPRRVSDDGQSFTGSGYLPLNAGSFTPEFVWVASLHAVGQKICGPAAANSRGYPGSLLATGDLSAAAGTFRLEATLLPFQTTGYFLAARATGSSQPPGSAGTLCLGGAVGRFVGPGQVGASGTSGAFGLDVDLTAIPTSTGFATIAAGETHYFQAWYRDAGMGTTSNFTDALRVTFL